MAPSISSPQLLPVCLHQFLRPQPYALEVSNQVQAEEAERNDKRGELPLSLSDPANNDGLAGAGEGGVTPLLWCRR